MSFSVGQKVMCIKPRWKGRNFNHPKFMHIYTVRAHCRASDIPSILLEEIHNREVCFARTFKFSEASFAAKFFRPLEDLTHETEKEIEA